MGAKGSVEAAKINAQNWNSLEVKHNCATKTQFSINNLRASSIFFKSRAANQAGKDIYTIKEVFKFSH